MRKRVCTKESGHLSYRIATYQPEKQQVRHQVYTKYTKYIQARYVTSQVRSLGNRKHLSARIGTSRRTTQSSFIADWSDQLSHHRLGLGLGQHCLGLVLSQNISFHICPLIRSLTTTSKTLSSTQKFCHMYLKNISSVLQIGMYIKIIPPKCNHLFDREN